MLKNGFNVEVYVCGMGTEKSVNIVLVSRKTCIWIFLVYCLLLIFKYNTNKYSLRNINIFKAHLYSKHEKHNHVKNKNVHFSTLEQHIPRQRGQFSHLSLILLRIPKTMTGHHCASFYFQHTGGIGRQISVNLSPIRSK